MNNNNNNSENRRSSATDWELETANTLCDAFENKIAFEKILDLLQEKQSVDQVVDSLFSLIRAPESQQLPLQEEKEEEEEEEEEETERVILIEEEEEVEEDQEDQEEEEEEEQVLERSEISVEEEEEEEEEEAEEEEYDSAKESIPEEIEENYEDVFASQTSLVELKDKYTVDSSTLSTSVYNEIPLSQSIMTTIRTIAKTAEEKTVQTDENNVRFFQERIESLSLQLDAATEAKIKVEEEKKNALKFCVTQVTAIKESMAEKEELIAKQEQEIAQLRKQLEESKNVPSSESKFEKYFSDSKVALIQGVETLSQQITENIAKVHAEFRNEDKEWVIMKRLQEFATEFRKEMNDLFSKNSLPPRAPIVIQPALEKEKANDDEEKDFWQTEKASLESYIKELEDRLKFYEDQEKAKNDSLFSSITSASDLLVESLSNATTYGSSLLDAPSVSSFEQSNPNFLDSTPSQQSAQPVQQPAHQPVQPQLQPFIFPPPVSDIWGPVYPSSPPQPFNHYWRVNPPTVPSYPSSFGYSQYPPHNPNYRNY